jgi:hypothetical protein
MNSRRYFADGIRDSAPRRDPRPLGGLSVIPFVGFNSEIDVPLARQLLRFASELSYRQYCILALAMHTESFDLFKDHAGSIGRDKLSSAQTSFLSDCWDLWLFVDIVPALF